MGRTHGWMSGLWKMEGGTEEPEANRRLVEAGESGLFLFVEKCGKYTSINYKS